MLTIIAAPAWGILMGLGFSIVAFKSDGPARVTSLLGYLLASIFIPAYVGAFTSEGWSEQMRWTDTARTVAHSLIFFAIIVCIAHVASRARKRWAVKE